MEQEQDDQSKQSALSPSAALAGYAAEEWGSPKIGVEYQVTHSRKGRFRMKIQSINGEWITGTITDGNAAAMCDYNEREKGEEITVRESFCTFRRLSA